MLGVDNNKWSEKTTIIAMETVGADSMHQSLQKDQIVTLPGISSVAKSLGAASPSPTVFDMCKKRGNFLKSRTCEDKDAIKAVL